MPPPLPPELRTRLEGHLAMLLFSLIVAGSFSFGKIIAGEIDPVALTALRFALAAGILAAILAATGRLKRAHYRHGWRYLVLGGAFVLYFVMMFEALKTATPVSTSAVFTLMPLMAAILDRMLSGRRSTPLVWLALALGGAGALWVVFRGSLAAFLSLDLGWGEFLFLIGTAGHAAYAVLVPKLRRGDPVYAVTLGVTTGGALILTVLFWPRLLATDWASLGLHVWAVLLYLTVFASLGTFSLVTIAAQRLPSAKVTAYTYLTPFWVVALEFALGNGLPGAFTLIGAVAIVGALVILFFEDS